MSEYTHLFKGAVVGAGGAGKTALVSRLCDDAFDKKAAQPTVGTDYRVKEKVTVNGTTAKVQLWDTAGHERFRALAATTLAGANFVLLCYDVSEPSSFVDVESIYLKLCRASAPNAKLYVVGLKADKDRAVTEAQAEELVKTYAMAKALSASSATGAGAAAVLEQVLADLLAAAEVAEAAAASAKRDKRRAVASKSIRTEELETQLAEEEERRKLLLKALAKKREEEAKAEGNEKVAGAQKKTFTSAEKEEIRVVFETFDKDASGKVDSAELGEIAKSLGVELGEDDIAQTLKQLDTDADGKLSFDEFLVWWGSDSSLGGNKGVKLQLIKARMTAKLMKEHALKKLRDMPKVELSSNTIDADLDVMAGRVPSDWEAPTEVHGTVLPMTAHTFEQEAKKEIKKLQDGGALQDMREDYFESGVGEDLEGAPIAGMVKVTYELRDGAEGVQDAIDSFQACINQTNPADSEETTDKPIPRILVTEVNGKPVLEVYLFRRKIELDQKLLAVMSELLVEKETSTLTFDKLLDSFAFSLKLGADLEKAVNDPDRRLDDLLDKVHASFKGSVNRGLLDVLQHSLFFSVPSLWSFDDTVRKAMFKMFQCAFLGTAAVKVKLGSIPEAVKALTKSFAAIHGEVVQNAVEVGDIEMTPELAETLADGALEKMWDGFVEQTLHLKPLELFLMGFRGACLGVIEDAGVDVGLAELMFLFRKSVAGAPVQVQVLSKSVGATLRLRGFEFLSGMLPSSADDLATWSEWIEEASERLEERTEKHGEYTDKLFDEDYLGEAFKGADVSREGTRIAVGGLPGAGKTSLVHALATGMVPGETKPSDGVHIKLAKHRGHSYSLWDLHDAENGFEACNQVAVASAGADKNVVWVVDGSKGVADDDKKACRALLELSQEGSGTSEPCLLIVVAKADLIEGGAEARAAAVEEAKAKLMEGSDEWPAKPEVVLTASCSSRDAESVQRVLPQLAGLAKGKKHQTPGDGAAERLSRLTDNSDSWSSASS
eukprot:TRINITY_DN19636_c0_g1_i1.p1 TRINITY_DN19636_c0_g1~~TRINITY_DN19636_c0_g1_i1.p1  ORF type:complete len:1003 (+),score=390.04 TRINITY_DN19636_c0_g1_i1:60-3068(+)